MDDSFKHCLIMTLLSDSSKLDSEENATDDALAEALDED